MGKIRIRDKHSGFATLLYLKLGRYRSMRTDPDLILDPQPLLSKTESEIFGTGKDPGKIPDPDPQH
jgi:hypothetical protein